MNVKLPWSGTMAWLLMGWLRSLPLTAPLVMDVPPHPEPLDKYLSTRGQFAKKPYADRNLHDPFIPLS